MKFEEMINQVIQGDCLEIMRQLPDKCIDLVVADPPYGITGIEWDDIEVFKSSIDNMMRVAKAVILFGNIQMHQYLKNFKFEFIWDKHVGANFASVKHRPLRVHEFIFVCGDYSYYPVLARNTLGNFGRKSVKMKSHPSTNLGSNYQENMGYPKTILSYLKPINLTDGGLHPTQKPIKLLEYLVRNFSKENDIILDPFLGSGTTAVAAKQLGRNYIGIEISEKYCEIARQRLRQEILL